MDPDGSLRSPVPLADGLTYTVISRVPYRNRTQLQGAPSHYSQSIRNHYLQLPPEIVPKVRQQTETLLAQAPRPLTSAYEQALFLTQALKQNYTVQPDLPGLGEEDLVNTFLFKYQGGYPDHFATTLTVMLRSIGLPTRLVTGFGPGQFNPFTGLYEVKNTDAYAIAEVYFPKFGWYAFDPIPGHDLFPPSVEVNQTFSVLRTFWHWLAGWLPSPLTGWISGLVAIVATAVGHLWGHFTQGWSGIFLGLLFCGGLGLLGWLGWHGWRWWRYHRWLTSLPGMERLYQQMLNWLATQGQPKQATQTPLEYLTQVQTQSAPAHTESVARITHAYLAWRYGGQSPPLHPLRQQLHQLQRRRRSKRPLK